MAGPTTGAGRFATSAEDERAERLRAAEARISRVTWLLENLFRVPGSERRFGLEPIIGLLPGAGDAISGIVGLALIVEALRFRLPKVVIVRMVMNTLLDLVVGIVPVLGDVFDFAFKSNSRNLTLFRRYAADPDRATTGEAAFVVGVILVVVGALLGALLAVGWLLDALARALGI
jgi:hypothetical protein